MKVAYEDVYNEEALADFETDLDVLIREVNARLLWPFQIEGRDSEGGHFLIFSCDVPAYGITCPGPAYLRRKIIWGDLSVSEKRHYIADAGYRCLEQNSPSLIPSFEDYYTEEETP